MKYINYFAFIHISLISVMLYKIYNKLHKKDSAANTLKSMILYNVCNKKEWGVMGYLRLLWLLVVLWLLVGARGCSWLLVVVCGCSGCLWALCRGIKKRAASNCSP